ncbi:MAG TPA: hypothetical protein VFV50_17290 [Bdellovibrionales bacterium]|nr:hypothetical protein [Bdellovibrionales bacterium]
MAKAILTVLAVLFPLLTHGQVHPFITNNYDGMHYYLETTEAGMQLTAQKIDMSSPKTVLATGHSVELVKVINNSPLQSGTNTIDRGDFVALNVDGRLQLLSSRSELFATSITADSIMLGSLAARDLSWTGGVVANFSLKRGGSPIMLPIVKPSQTLPMATAPKSIQIKNPVLGAFHFIEPSESGMRLRTQDLDSYGNTTIATAKEITVLKIIQSSAQVDPLELRTGDFAALSIDRRLYFLNTQGELYDAKTSVDNVDPATLNASAGGMSKGKEWGVVYSYRHTGTNELVKDVLLTASPAVASNGPVVTPERTVPPSPSRNAYASGTRLPNGYVLFERDGARGLELVLVHSSNPQADLQVIHPRSEIYRTRVYEHGSVKRLVIEYPATGAKLLYSLPSGSRQTLQYEMNLGREPVFAGGAGMCGRAAAP